jgi:hypothetical protein
MERARERGSKERGGKTREGTEDERKGVCGAGWRRYNLIDIVESVEEMRILTLLLPLKSQPAQ